MSKSVLCIAVTPNQARTITESLKSAGFHHDDISVLLADHSKTRDFADEKVAGTPEGTVTGAGAGGMLGAALGWLVGIGSLAIPGAGLFLAAGPLLATLGGLTAGAVAGGLGGALIGMGISDEDARGYERRLNAGNILISVHIHDRDQMARAKAIFERESAEEISCSDESSMELSAARRRLAGEGGTYLPIH